MNWKTTFDGRQPLTEADLWWKTILYGRDPSRKTTFDKIWHFTEDDLWWKLSLAIYGYIRLSLAMSGYSGLFQAISEYIKISLAVSGFKNFWFAELGEVAWCCQTSCDVARLLLMAPIEPWQNSTPIFGAAAFCTTKIGNFRASSTLRSLTTWSTYSSKRRPLRKDQLEGTKRKYSPYV